MKSILVGLLRGMGKQMVSVWYSVDIEDDLGRKEKMRALVRQVVWVYLCGLI